MDDDTLNLNSFSADASTLNPTDNSLLSKTKRPPNAYILYCLEKRGELREQYPDMPNIEISKMLGERWKDLDEAYKRPYKERAKDLQTEFKQKNPEYKYEKARKRRQEQEMLIQQSKRPIPFDLTSLSNGDQQSMNPDITYLISILLQQQGSKQKMSLPATLAQQPPQPQTSSYNDFPFVSDLFENHPQ